MVESGSVMDVKIWEDEEQEKEEENNVLLETGSV